MKALIVEDSRLARNELKELLNRYPDITIEGEASGADEAYTWLTRSSVDLMFLDINMPGKNGFDLLEMLDDIPLVIFTTAYDEYAVKSFEYNALDYLLKPVKPEAMERAITKARKIIGQEQSVNGKISCRVFIKDGERCWLVNPDEIFLIESEGNYSRIYFQNNKPLINKSLNAVEGRLDTSKFIRVNRRQIVHLNFIKSARLSPGSAIILILQNDAIVEVSRRNTLRLKSILSF
jgi:two-component system, LytTR family, response regulator